MRKDERFACMLVKEDKSCQLCKEKHQFWKCLKYKELSPQKRFEFVKGTKKCFNCFKDGHSTRKCLSKNTCFKSDCNERHHTTLHDYFIERGRMAMAKKGTNTKEQFNGLTSTIKDVFLQIVPVTLHANNKSIETYALLDNGSQSTFLRQDIAKRLKLKGKERIISLTTVKDQSESVKVEEISLDVSSRDGKYRISVESAFSTPGCKFNMPSRPRLDYDLQRNPHLNVADFEPVDSKKVTMLIGANIPEALLCTEVRRGNKDQPLAVKTKFGWTLFGSSAKTDADDQVHIKALYQQNPAEKNDEAGYKDLNKSLERFWIQENVGILSERDIAMSIDDMEASKVLEKNTKLLDGRYEVPMLWKNEEVRLPNNISMARKRFSYLEKKLRSNSELHKGFKAVIDGYLNQDPPVARKLTPKEVNQENKRTWYLPMHPVTNPHKPGKIRVVNDAAAVYDGKSLNKALLTGPDLLNSLVGILIKFRTGRIAIAADVKDHFHRVRVSREDADSLRFLWKDDIFSPDPPDTYQMLVHIFGAKDSPACANYALKRVARDNERDYDKATYETVMKNFYVDDLLKSVKSEEEAVRLSKELISMLRQGSFRLTKFSSNSRKVLEALPQEEVSSSASLNIDIEKTERALGVSWDTVKDVFTFPTKLKDAPITKRGILSTTSSLFDPLGFLSPFILKAKILLQELWRLNYEWDQEVDEKMLNHWNRWLDGAKKVSDIKLSRQYACDDSPIKEVQLHVFCDASEAAYGCVAYLRFTFESGEHKCAFVMSKSRLAPIKTITLPRLELNAAQIGVRMASLITQTVEYPLQRVQYWSDSALTLQYIKNTKNRMKVFVANRVTEILDASKSDQWRHVPGAENPADLASRGVTDPDRLVTGNWFSGPEFLYKDEDAWPNMSVEALSPDDVEVKRKDILVATGIVTGDIDMSRYSDWLRMKRIFAWCLRFTWNCRSKKEDRKTGVLTFEEIKAAEHRVIKKVQQAEFSDEMKILKGGKELPNKSKLVALYPFLDDQGILRVGGRLKNVNISDEARHPAVLPGSHHVTRLIISDIHRRNGHVGVEHVLSLLRTECWVTGARTAIKTVLRHCFLCKIRRSVRQFPLMADLPKGRGAMEQPPFSNTGVDLFGPIYVKEGRKRIKRWVVLFTCLTVRCVHLEVVENADTDAYINAMRRFVNRRGCPSVMYSDQGSNFRGAAAELKEFVSKLSENNKIEDFASTFKIKWQFNPPGAPHMGGVWERLVRSVKEVMTGLMRNYVLTDPQLLTLLTEVESIINSRPLTHVSDDLSDLEALTPNHILLGKHRNWAYVSDIKDNDVTSRKKFKQVQAIAKIFWDRWKKEYLPRLTQRPKWRTSKPSFKVGELVILQDDNYKRGKWPLARITKVMPGKDNITRVIQVRTRDGDYTRPVSKLYKLEEDTCDETVTDSNKIPMKLRSSRRGEC